MNNKKFEKYIEEELSIEKIAEKLNLSVDDANKVLFEYVKKNYIKSIIVDFKLLENKFSNYFVVAKFIMEHSGNLREDIVEKLYKKHNLSFDILFLEKPELLESIINNGFRYIFSRIIFEVYDKYPDRFKLSKPVMDMYILDALKHKSENMDVNLPVTMYEKFKKEYDYIFNHYSFYANQFVEYLINIKNVKLAKEIFEKFLSKKDAYCTHLELLLVIPNDIDEAISYYENNKMYLSKESVISFFESLIKNEKYEKFKEFLANIEYVDIVDNFTLIPGYVDLYDDDKKEINYSSLSDELNLAFESCNCKILDNLFDYYKQNKLYNEMFVFARRHKDRKSYNKKIIEIMLNDKLVNLSEYDDKIESLLCYGLLPNIDYSLLYLYLKYLKYSNRFMELFNLCEEYGIPDEERDMIGSDEVYSKFIIRDIDKCIIENDCECAMNLTEEHINLPNMKDKAIIIIINNGLSLTEAIKLYNESNNLNIETVIILINALIDNDMIDDAVIISKKYSDSIKISALLIKSLIKRNDFYDRIDIFDTFRRIKNGCDIDTKIMYINYLISMNKYGLAISICKENNNDYRFALLYLKIVTDSNYLIDNRDELIKELYDKHKTSSHCVVDQVINYLMKNNRLKEAKLICEEHRVISYYNNLYEDLENVERLSIVEPDDLLTNINKPIDALNGEYIDYEVYIEMIKNYVDIMKIVYLMAYADKNKVDKSIYVAQLKAIERSGISDEQRKLVKKLLEKAKSKVNVVDLKSYKVLIAEVVLLFDVSKIDDEDVIKELK